MTFPVVIEYGTPQYHETVSLRYDILREPLGIDFTAKQLAEEYDSHHLAIVNIDLEVLACLVVKPLDHNRVKIRQVAVKADTQGQGVGTTLSRFTEQYILGLGITQVELSARETAVPFYIKQGYQKVGTQYLEIDIPHFKMIKSLPKG